MNSVKESLLEFQRGGDPKEALGIGPYRTQFNSIDDFTDALILLIPMILKTTEIPKNIIATGPTTPYLVVEIFNKIDDYTRDKNIKIGDDYAYHCRWPIVLKKKLISMGFSINANESLSFNRGGDPKEVLGIGDYRTEFDDSKEFMDYLIPKLPKILGTKKIPKNIISQPSKYIRHEYFEKIQNYIEDKNIELTGDWCWIEDLRDELNLMGFQRAIGESLSFQRGNDPKVILGIGNNFDSLDTFLNYLISEIPNILNSENIPEDIIQDNNHWINSKYFHDIIDFLDTKKIKIQNITYLKYAWIDLLNKKLSDMGFSTKVDESISFTRGNDPKEVLGIGEEFKTKFDSTDEFMEYLIRNLPRILGTKKIPRNIIKDEEAYIKAIYYNRIQNYLNKKNIIINGRDHNDVYWEEKFQKELKKMGYKEE